MIDLHCHLLPGIDDGPPDLPRALEMARIAAGDGIRVVACTPHIYPGLYDNDATGIRIAVDALRGALLDADIALELVCGADVHLEPGLAAGVACGRVATLAGSRYLLLEPPHHSMPPGFEQSIFELMAAGLTPVITHPERLTWVEAHYHVFARLVKRGCWMQVTSGALTGRFGPRVRYMADRFIAEGKAHLLATDAHDPTRRPPLLAEGRRAAARLIGEVQAGYLVEERPAWILADRDPSSALLPEPAAGTRSADGKGWGPEWFKRLVRRHNSPLV
ncbi:tyrosine-protein phosphatase [Luteimonas vadosa]|uniref:protein-tyrosine-phosphatase n=1 Tax=Luteimonas vadosa TaxID=1165507 RepID=A0ABP9DVA7_9GAMM